MDAVGQAWHLLVSCLSLQADASLFQDGLLDTVFFWKGDFDLVSSNDENVLQSRCKSLAARIFDVSNVGCSRMLFNLSQGSDSPGVSPLGDHDVCSNVKLVEAQDFSFLNVESDGVADLDVRGWEADSSAVVGGDVWDSSSAKVCLGDLAELGLGSARRDWGQNHASLSVVKDAEVLVSSRNADNVHETCRVSRVLSAFSVNLDKSVHEDHFDFTSSEGIFQTVSETNDERQALSELVRTSGRTRSPNTAQFVKHPMLGSC